MKTALCLLVLAALIVACARDARRDDSGQIVVAGRIKATSLNVGDCFQDQPGLAMGDVIRVRSFDAIPCGEPHDNEVFLVTGPLEVDDWPGDDYVRSFASASCLGAFESFVGRDHASSHLEYGYIRPTQESWDVDNGRTIVCFLFDPVYPPLIGSMRASRE